MSIQPLYDGLTIFPPLKYSGNFSAGIGLFTAVIFIMKYFPILIFGALNRLEERYKKDSRRYFRSGAPGKLRWLRGVFPAFIVLPTAIAGLILGPEIKMLILRLISDIV
jgi:hypothetical protein